jgi:hypothetical protein
MVTIGGEPSLHHPYNPVMARLGALTRAWTAAEAALPLGWHIAEVWRFDGMWIALSQGPGFDDYLSGSGRFVEQALHRLSERLRERRGVQSG